jgi:hypothetical protein
MTHRATLRLAVTTLLALLLLAPPAALAQGRAAASPNGHAGLLSAVWSFLTSLLPHEEALDTRCTIDPNGGSSCTPSGAAPDNRCTIDPDGRMSCGPGF